MLQKLRDWFRRLMYGRYGTDGLNMTLFVAALVCSLLGKLGIGLIPNFLSTFLLIYIIYRMFSRNITARQREMAAFNRFKKFFTDRQHCYYACPGCGQTVRVPRGKGRVSIHCPRCGARFEKKT